jgi:hypothetical protein
MAHRIRQPRLSDPHLRQRCVAPARLGRREQRDGAIAERRRRVLRLPLDAARASRELEYGSKDAADGPRGTNRGMATIGRRVRQITRLRDMLQMLRPPETPVMASRPSPSVRYSRRQGAHSRGASELARRYRRPNKKGGPKATLLGRGITSVNTRPVNGGQKTTKPPRRLRNGQVGLLLPYP